MTIGDVQADLAAYPPDWPVVGVGATDQIGRNDEMLSDGKVNTLRFWWADPATPPAGDEQTTGGAVYDLLFPPLCLSLSPSWSWKCWTASSLSPPTTAC